MPRILGSDQVHCLLRFRQPGAYHIARLPIGVATTYKPLSILPPRSAGILIQML